jgi:hypothetical protein
MTVEVGDSCFLWLLLLKGPKNPLRSFMTEEECFSTIKITKKTKNADSSPIYALLRGGGLLGKKDKFPKT